MKNNNVSHKDMNKLLFQEDLDRLINPLISLDRLSYINYKTELNRSVNKKLCVKLDMIQPNMRVVYIKGIPLFAYLYKLKGGVNDIIKILDNEATDRVLDIMLNHNRKSSSGNVFETLNNAIEDTEMAHDIINEDFMNS